MSEQKTWIIDANNNRASVEYWGSEEKARESLVTLKRCSGCSDCSGCSYCSRCSYCSDCSRCSGCSDCSRCSYCSDCSDCSDCSRCSRCSDCSRCSYCSYCSRCSGCSRCSRCSYCSDCSDCSDCSRCSRCSGCSRCSYCSYCSRCSYCSGKKGEENKPEIRNTIPVIENIHQRIYEAASQPGALDMSVWHTCQKTHCRAGWAVTLAGDAGRKLESFFNTELAAMMIYEASGYKIHPARFIDDNAAAIEDMKRLAEKENA